MTTYAIGDIQGMYDPLMRLLEKIEFDPDQDKLWFAGDLVNRGPDSLKVLRYVKSLGDSAVTVLGNHDLHLIAASEGFKNLGKNRTLDEVLNAPDAEELLTWLRFCPLIHIENKFVLVHAGLPPQWSADEAKKLAGEVEAVLQLSSYHDFLSHMYGDKPDVWDDTLAGFNRLRFIVNAFTRMRVVTPEGKLLLDYSGPPESKPAGSLHWINAPNRQSSDNTIVCGHWAAQGLTIRADMRALDTGCVWNGALTAMSLDDDRVFQVECKGGFISG